MQQSILTTKFEIKSFNSSCFMHQVIIRIDLFQFELSIFNFVFLQLIFLQSINLVFYLLSILQRNSFYRNVRFANFGFSILFRQSCQRTSQEKHVYLHEFKRSWFVILDWWISIRPVCFVFQGSLLCDRPVSGNNRLAKFASQIF